MSTYNVPGHDIGILEVVIAIVAVLGAAAVLFGLFFAYLWLSNFIVTSLGRIAFAVKLKRICKKNGWTCKRKHFILRSLFSSYPGADYIIYEEGKMIYRLKFFPFLIRRKFCTLEDEVFLVMRTKIFLWRMGARGAAKTVPGYHGRANGHTVFIKERFVDLTFENPTKIPEDKRNDRTLLYYNPYGEFFEAKKRNRRQKAFDSFGEKILLIPHKNCYLTFTATNKMYVVDNGVEFVNGAKFYGQKSFLKKIKDK